MSVQRYKVGYYTDEWGMSSNTPCLLRDDNGYAVKFDDYALLKKQRDDLLAALTKLSGMKLNMIADGIVDKAIASVKGEQ